MASVSDIGGNHLFGQKKNKKHYHQPTNLNKTFCFHSEMRLMKSNAIKYHLIRKRKPY